MNRRLLFTAGSEVLAGEMLFGLSPARRVIGVVRRQDPNTMKVVGQQDGGKQREWTRFLDHLDGLAKELAAEVRCENRPSMKCDDREEVGAAEDVISPVVGHV